MSCYWDGLADVSPSHMSNIETGTTRVSLTTIVVIANALQVAADDLLCDNIIQCKAQFQHELAGLLENCDEYEIRIAKDTLAALIAAFVGIKNYGIKYHKSYYGWDCLVQFQLFLNSDIK